MSLKIYYSQKTTNTSSSNLVLFSDDKFNLNGLKKFLSNSEYSYIQDLLKTNDLKKKLTYFWVKFKKKDSFNIS